jgi:hypothetical protein
MVWACTRASVDGQWCMRHEPHADPRNAPALELAQDVDADADALAYVLAEGLTLAEVASLTRG